MSEKVAAPHGSGEEWWRRLSSAQKLAMLKPYFDADERLNFLHEGKANKTIADMLGIHVSSVALQRRRYWRELEKVLPAPDYGPLENRYHRLLSILPAGAPHPPPPAHKGHAWWRSLSTEKKYAVVRELIEVYGLSTSQIAMYLELPSRSHVAGVRHRLSKKHGAPKPLAGKDKKPV